MGFETQDVERKVLAILKTLGAWVTTRSTSIKASVDRVDFLFELV
jgi:hypothetical protein